MGSGRQHGDSVESSAPWLQNTRRYAVRPPDHHEWEAPRVPTNRIGATCANGATKAVARGAATTRRQTRRGSVSQTTCERMPAAKDRKERGERDGVDSGRADQHRFADPAPPPDIVTQGTPPSARTAGTHRRPTHPAMREGIDRASMGYRANNARQANTASPPHHHTNQTQRVNFPAAPKCSRIAASMNRIARRVRLVERDVAVADAQREVDRIEVLERRRRNGRCSARKRPPSSAPASRWLRVAPAAAADPRSDCRCGTEGRW